MKYAGLLGPTSTVLSPSTSCDRTVNYYCEALEVPGAQPPKADAALYQRAGSRPFGPVPSLVPQPVRAMLEFDGNGVPNGAIFVVAGNTFYQQNADGGVTVWGTVVDDGAAVQIVANAASVGQLFIASGGHGYCLNSGVFREIPNDGINFFGARDVAFIDGYFVVTSDTVNRQQFQISALNDGTTWDGTDVALLLGQADPIVSVIANIEYLYFIGLRRGQIWYNNGNPLFPFTIESGAFLEVGTCAHDSVCQSSNTVFWIGQDARGANVAMQVQGLASHRISTHAVEQLWSKYSTTVDCICYPLTWNGHSLIRYIFPTANKGWEYDVTEAARVGYPVWNEISFTDAQGVQHAPVERAHCYAFGKHLIGSGGADGQPGQVYQLDEAIYEDCEGLNPYGTAIQGTGTAAMVAGVSASDTSMAVFGLLFTPTVGEYLMLGGFPGGEIVQLTAFTPPVLNTSTFTILRGQGGTVPTVYAANSAVDEIIVPGFPITRDRIIRLPYNNGLRQFLDRLEFLVQSGDGIPGFSSIFSGTTTPGSATLLVADTTGLATTQSVTGVGIAPGSTIISLIANTSITLSLPANSTGTNPLIATANIAGANPKLILRISRDGGRTWGSEISISMGRLGAYQTRILVNRLGYYRDGAIWIRITDPVFACLVGAEHYIRQGVN